MNELLRTQPQSVKVYLAGPIFGKSDADCNDWRSSFKAVSGFEWLDPMSRDYRGREDEAFEELVENDKADVDSCSVLIADVRLGPSHGTSMEILWAWLDHTPVVTMVKGRVSPWLRYHSTKLVADEAEAMAALREICASL
jgi:nucleoside 2-deoxyribosyltransferase